MHLLTVLLTSLVSQPFETGPIDFDVSAVKAELVAVSDGKKHFMVFQQGKPLGGMTFYGDGKTFYRLRSPGGGASGDESFGITLWDPRVGFSNGRPSFDMKKDEKGQHFTVSCGARTTPMEPLPAADSAKLIAEASFKGPLWTRLPLRLLRDDTGTYFFIDVLRDESGEHRDHRVFVGARGKMKLLPLKNVVDDSEGIILATRDGQLRLVANKASDDRAAADRDLLKWVAGKKVAKLTEVPIESGNNGAMIYNDLGVYEGQRLGTPCDDLR